MFDQHAGRVYAYAARRSTLDVANEVVGETFLIAWRKLDAVPADPLPWLLNVAGKVLANRRRSDQRRDAFTAERAQALRAHLRPRRRHPHEAGRRGGSGSPATRRAGSADTGRLGRPGRASGGGGGWLLPSDLLRPTSPSPPASDERTGAVATLKGKRTIWMTGPGEGGQVDMRTSIVDSLVREADPFTNEEIETWRRSPQ